MARRPNWFAVLGHGVVHTQRNCEFVDLSGFLRVLDSDHHGRPPRFSGAREDARRYAERSHCILARVSNPAETRNILVEMVQQARSELISEGKIADFGLNELDVGGLTDEQAVAIALAHGFASQSHCNSER
jgi:hypothetical protein